MSNSTFLELGPGYCLAVEDAPAEADVEILPHALEAYNEERWPQHPPWRPLAVFLREEAKIVAGLAGETYCGWLFVKYLWVSEGLRGRGVGRELILRAESCARALGCHSAWLDTFSFQARGFYEKLGYSEFGRLDYPPGHSRHFLQKRLVSDS
ncbi:MAG TPA: GNAT family N-acetyltransferase [Stellaceae bacterium]|jgi:GNAT superfamily N-acetyltransferase